MVYPTLKPGINDLGGQTYTGWQIKDIKGDPANPIRITNGTLVDVQILKSAYVILDGLTILGGAGSAAVNTLPSNAQGVYVRWSDHIEVRNCDVSRAYIGVTILDSPDCAVIGNDIHAIRTDMTRYVNAPRARIQWNRMWDWRPSPGDHCDGVQGWNDGLGGPADGVVISDNCIYRAALTDFAAMGINDRYYGPPTYPTRSGFTNMRVDRNLLIGLAHNAMELNYDVTAEDNEIYSFTDVKSVILFAKDTVKLIGNKAQGFSPDRTFSKVATPSPDAAKSNVLNAPIDPAVVPGLVAAWTHRRIAALRVPQLPPVHPGEPPEPEQPPVEETPAPAPDTPPVTFTAAQKAKLVAMIEAL